MSEAVEVEEWGGIEPFISQNSLPETTIEPVRLLNHSDSTNGTGVKMNGDLPFLSKQHGPKIHEHKHIRHNSFR